jgi:hypothetical protein
MLCRWLSYAIVAALAISSVDGFASNTAGVQQQGKGSLAYVSNAASYRRRWSSHVPRQRDRASHLYFNPANMMAKLSSDIVSSIETAFESPDFKSLFLAMDDQTWLSIIVYSFVFWVGMFVAVSSDDMKPIPPEKKRKILQPPISASAPMNYEKYTTVATNSQSAWNMENDRRQQQQQQQLNSKQTTDDAVAAMWKRREEARTVITYERATAVPPAPSPLPPPVAIMAAVPAEPFAPRPAPATRMTPPAPATIMTSPPLAPAPAVYSRPAAVSAPAMTSAQYMAGLGSSSAVKRSYAVSGPNYSTIHTNHNHNNGAVAANRKSYDMVQWTPNTPVAITSLYLAKMSGPDRPALGSYYQVPVYFSPGVILNPTVIVEVEEEETYYYNEPQQQQPEENYDDDYEQEDDDHYGYDIPQGKGSGYHHRSYAPTRWKPDMRVNESVPGASKAYLSNMRQPSYYQPAFAVTTNDDDDDVDSNVYANGRMNGFPSELLSDVNAGSVASSSLYGTANGLSNGVANGQSNGVIANNGSSSLEAYLKSANANGIANNAASLVDPYGISSWQQSPSTMAATSDTPLAHSDSPSLYPPPSIATAVDQEPHKKKSYSMTNWKPGSHTSVNGSPFAGNSYLAAINSPTTVTSSPASAQDESPEIHAAPAPVPFQPSFATDSDTAISIGAGTVSKKSYSMTKWGPESPTVANSSSFGNSYHSVVSSTQPDESLRYESPVAYQPPGPSPYQPVNSISSWSPATASTTNSAYGVSYGSPDPGSPANGAVTMFSEPQDPVSHQSSFSATADDVKAVKNSYSVSKWKPDAKALDDSSSSAVYSPGFHPPSLTPPPAVPERPAPTSYHPTFADMPASYSNYPTVGQSSSMSSWKQTRTSDSITGNAYFNGMGSMYGNAEAPRSSPPRLYQNPPPFGNENSQNVDDASGSREQDSWRSPAGPPVWGVAESETPKRVQQMQMQT